MTPPATPTASSSKIKPRKPKNPKGKSRKEKAASPDADVANSGVSTRIEGVDPSLAYTPPAGSVPADYDVEFGEFDYDAIKADERTELWLIRAPVAVRLQFGPSLRILHCQLPPPPSHLTECLFSPFLHVR
jgi:hypothetical protein